MLIRAFNDIHLDFDLGKRQNLSDLWEPIALENDHKTTLIISGDIWHSMKFLDFKNFSWFQKISTRFERIIFVLGNHDLWHGNLALDYAKVKKEIINQKLFNVHLLQNDILDIEDIRFLGATLWTSLKNGDPLVSFSARGEKDFKFIRNGASYKKLTPQDIYSAHIKSKNFIFSNAKKGQNINKIVVITHHAPSYKSIADEHKIYNSYDNFYYCSDLDNEIFDSSIDYWFHGHTHNPIQYKIGNTCIINNARGYNGHEETGYNPEGLFVI